MCNVRWRCSAWRLRDRWPPRQCGLVSETCPGIPTCFRTSPGVTGNYLGAIGNVRDTRARFGNKSRPPGPETQPKVRSLSFRHGAKFGRPTIRGSGRGRASQISLFLASQKHNVLEVAGCPYLFCLVLRCQREFLVKGFCVRVDGAR